MHVLAIGAHPDDVELGCGGTLLAHRARGHQVTILVLTTGDLGPQDLRSRIAEQEEAAELIGAQLIWGGLEDGAISESRHTVELIERVLRTVEPDVVYTHCPRDTHQDHRATANCTLAATRRLSRVLFYESPTSVGFQPSVYVDIDPYVEGKVEALRAHVSQVLKNGLVDLEAIEALARYRGFQARIRRAEAFEAERLVWDLSPAYPGAATSHLLHTITEDHA